MSSRNDKRIAAPDFRIFINPSIFVIRISPFPSFQSPLIKFDQIEISPNVFTSFTSRFFEKMEKTRFFCGGVGMTGDHRLVPLFDRFRGMSRSVLLYPV